MCASIMIANAPRFNKNHPRNAQTKKDEELPSPFIFVSNCLISKYRYYNV